MPAGPNHPDFLVADSCGGQYVARKRVDCTCQPALPTHSRLGAYMWPGDGLTVLASQPQPPRLFGCGFMWGPICGQGTARLYLPASPTHPQLSGGLYVAWGPVDCTCQPAPTTQTFWLQIHVGANMWPGDGSTVLASWPQPPRLFGCGFMWWPICGRGPGNRSAVLASRPYPPTHFWEPSFPRTL